MATAGDQINRALRLLGVLAEGETPSAATSQDALTALNQMIESWGIERLSTYELQEQSFTWPANTASRTLGASGNFSGTRPTKILDSTYFKDTATGVSYGIKIINADQYNSIATKTTTATYPQVVWVNMTHPNLTMTIYPVATTAVEWHIMGAKEITQPAATSTTIANPPGYLRAFAFNLALELAPEFGVEPSSQVKRIARISKAALKRINAPEDVMVLPSSIINNNSRYNINAGNY